MLSATIDYCGETEFLDGKVKYIHTEEGLVEYQNGTSSFTYEYFLKDHLGNTRAVVSADATGNLVVAQSYSYYPFGMAFSSNNSTGTSNKYLYNGKELQDETLGGISLGLYDYGARFYDPAIGRFTTIDPAADRYPNISPYAYCANNPIIYIDPTGMYIEEGSQKEWEKQKGNVTSERDRLQNRVDKLTAKAEAKGWSSEKLASRIGDKTERIGSLNTSLGSMGTLEGSSQGYSLSHTAAGENGGVTLNTGTNTLDIKFGSGNTANFVHEVTHTGQFETGNMAFDSKSGMTLAQDIHDEVSAYKAQYAYDPSSVSGLTSTSYANSFGAITTSWVQGLAGGTLYAPGGTANTGIGPLNINSTRTDFINAYPSNPALKTLPASFILKTSYPNIYYKK